MEGLINWKLLLPAMILKGFQVGPTGKPVYNVASPVSGILQMKVLEQMLKGMSAPSTLSTASYTPPGVGMATGGMSYLLPLLLFSLLK